jgi:hypothetical protein
VPHRYRTNEPSSDLVYITSIISSHPQKFDGIASSTPASLKPVQFGISDSLDQDFHPMTIGACRSLAALAVLVKHLFSYF